MPEYDRRSDPDLTPTARRDDGVAERADGSSREKEAIDPQPYRLFGDGGQRRRKRFRKISAEIERNRRGDFKVPTWVLAACLVAFILAWALWIFLG